MVGRESERTVNDRARDGFATVLFKGVERVHATAAAATSRWTSLTKRSPRRRENREGSHRSRSGHEDPSCIQHPRYRSRGIRRAFAVPAAVELRQGDERHKWVHKAAVKAIAFCPWQDSLIATGGGFYDRRIHFHHTLSGTTLATIDVSAQVTSLVWSSTRREIAATLGFSRTAHPYRVAVFSWPACHLITAIPWAGDLRALHAIAYPLESSDTQRSEVDYRNRKAECIVVVSSKEDLRFYDLWPPTEKSVVCGVGMLGGSDILEHISGIDKDVGVIR